MNVSDFVRVNLMIDNMKHNINHMINISVGLKEEDELDNIFFQIDDIINLKAEITVDLLYLQNKVSEDDYYLYLVTEVESYYEKYDFENMVEKLNQMVEYLGENSSKL